MKRLILMCLILVASNVYAEKPNLVWCNNCSTTQMQAAAAKTGLGVTYVGDPINRVVHAYQTYIDVEDTNPPTRTRETYQIAVDPQLVNGVDAAISFYNMKPVGWIKRVTINASDLPADNFTSVYNIINAGSAQNRFGDDVNSLLSPQSDINRALGLAYSALIAFHIASADAGLNAIETWRFSDGSTVQYEYDHLTGKMVIDPDTARDAEGNNVPYLGRDGKIHNLGGVFEFDDDRQGNIDNTNFSNQLSLLNVSLFFEGMSRPHHQMSCIKSGDGPKAVYTCQIVP
ncbi:MAG TPA: hypothetical protein VFN13_06405 [Rudaea sp.]|nr:hypothetical protein [Rudaea sp.]